MSMPAIVESAEDGSAVRLVPTTPRDLGSDELFFEELIAASPELLELEASGPDIRGPFISGLIVSVVS